MKHYVMMIRDDHYWLVGPFDSEGDASAWGSDPGNNPTNDPRWQTLQLPDPHAAPVVVHPQE